MTTTPSSMNDAQSLWKAAEKAVVAGDAATLDRLLSDHKLMFLEHAPLSTWLGGLAPDYSKVKARSIITREHCFESWAEFEEILTALKLKDSPIARFEAAVDAVVDGDLVTIERLLHENPELIRARSTRKHRSTLLHYVGANGVESWRQKTPQQALQVAKTLCKAGAEVNAVAKMYGGSTTLGLVATSVHPLKAGVQNGLMEILLEYGADFDGAVASDYTAGSVVNACLANGRPGAAEFLARRGARLDLEGAAGVGRVDAVTEFFDQDGKLKANATSAQFKSGFQWACEYGRSDVVKFLMLRGIALGEIHLGRTGLHWAAYGGHFDIVRMLVERNAPVNIRDESWQNTPLGWALHGWANPPLEANGQHHHEIVALLINAGSFVDPKLVSEQIRADSRIMSALSGEMPLPAYN